MSQPFGLGYDHPYQPLKVIVGCGKTIHNYCDCIYVPNCGRVDCSSCDQLILPILRRSHRSDMDQRR